MYAGWLFEGEWGGCQCGMLSPWRLASLAVVLGRESRRGSCRLNKISEVLLSLALWCGSCLPGGRRNVVESTG